MCGTSTEPQYGVKKGFEQCSAALDGVDWCCGAQWHEVALSGIEWHWMASKENWRTTPTDENFGNKLCRFSLVNYHGICYANRWILSKPPSTQSPPIEIISRLAVVAVIAYHCPNVDQVLSYHVFFFSIFIPNIFLKSSIHQPNLYWFSTWSLSYTYIFRWYIVSAWNWPEKWKHVPLFLSPINPYIKFCIQFFKINNKQQTVSLGKSSRPPRPDQLDWSPCDHHLRLLYKHLFWYQLALGVAP